jgi:hypothetical protein
LGDYGAIVTDADQKNPILVTDFAFGDGSEFPQLRCLLSRELPGLIVIES